MDPTDEPYLCPRCDAMRDHPDAYCTACGYDPEFAAGALPKPIPPGVPSLRVTPDGDRRLRRAGIDPDQLGLAPPERPFSELLFGLTFALLFGAFTAFWLVSDVSDVDRSIMQAKHQLAEVLFGR